MQPQGVSVLFLYFTVHLYFVIMGIRITGSWRIAPGRDYRRKTESCL